MDFAPSPAWSFASKVTCASPVFVLQYGLHKIDKPWWRENA